MTERRWADELIPGQPLWVRDLITEELTRREAQLREARAQLREMIEGEAAILALERRNSRAEALEDAASELALVRFGRTWGGASQEEVDWLRARAASERKDDDYPSVECPSCRASAPDMDGFGFLRCPNCGHCTHPSLAGDKCTLCGAASERNEGA
jgi:rubrerythrin